LGGDHKRVEQRKTHEQEHRRGNNWIASSSFRKAKSNLQKTKANNRDKLKKKIKK